MIEFKQIINNLTIRRNIFNQVKSIHRYLLKNEKIRDKRIFKWVDVYRSFERLTIFGCLKELKERLENEEIDKDIIEVLDEDHYKIKENKNDDQVNKRKSVDDARDIKGKIDHRIIGLAEIACRRGHLEIVKYLNQHPQSHLAFSYVDLSEAISNGHIEIAEFLLDSRTEESYDALIEASKKGYSGLMDKMLTLRQKYPNKFGAMEFAINIESLKVLHKHGCVPKHSIQTAFGQQSLEMIEFIQTHYPSTSLVSDSMPFLMDILKKERFDIINYIIQHNKYIFINIQKVVEECIESGIIKGRENNSQAMNEFIDQHYPHIFNTIPTIYLPQFIYDHCDQPLPDDTPQDTRIKINNYLKTVEKSIEFMDSTFIVWIGGWRIYLETVDLRIIKYLHYNNPNQINYCTQMAMTHAINYGRLDVVEFLHQHRTEGYDVTQIDVWCLPDDMLRFLHLNRTEGFTFPETIDSPIETLKYIFDNNLTDIKVLQYGCEYSGYSGVNLEILRYLHYHTKIQVRVFYQYWYISYDLLSFLVNNRLNCINDLWINKESVNLMIGEWQMMFQDEIIDIMKLIHRIINHVGINDINVVIRHYGILKYLKYHFPQFKGYIIISFDYACCTNNILIVEYLLDNYPDIINFNYDQLVNQVDRFKIRSHGQPNQYNPSPKLFQILLDHQPQQLTQQSITKLLELIDEKFKDQDCSQFKNILINYQNQLLK